MEAKTGVWPGFRKELRPGKLPGHLRRLIPDASHVCCLCPSSWLSLPLSPRSNAAVTQRVALLTSTRECCSVTAVFQHRCREKEPGGSDAPGEGLWTERTVAVFSTRVSTSG